LFIYIAKVPMSLERVALLQAFLCTLHNRQIELDREKQETEQKIVQELKAVYPTVWVIQSIKEARWGGYVYAAIPMTPYVALFTTREKAMKHSKGAELYHVKESTDSWSDGAWLNLDTLRIDPLRTDFNE